MISCLKKERLYIKLRNKPNNDEIKTIQKHWIKVVYQSSKKYASKNICYE